MPQVDPWNVSDVVDYTKLVNEFGVQYLRSAYNPNETEAYDLAARFQSLINKPLHPLIERGHFFAHKDFDKLLDAYEAGKSIYLYTGRGPSSQSMHTGHLIPMQLTQWLQEVLGCALVLQLTDDEKYFWKDLGFEEARELAYNNARDILALGFDPERTFMFRNTDYVPFMYKNICRIQRAITYNTSKSVFGHVAEDSIAKVGFPPFQIAPALPSSFPHIFKGKNVDAEFFCLIPCAIDQHPYFSLSRDIAPRLNFNKTTLILARFLPSLSGSSKMSSSVGKDTTIFLDFSPEKIKEIISEAGSSMTTLIEWLSFFYKNQEEYEKIVERAVYDESEEYRKELEDLLIFVMTEIIEEFNDKRKEITDEMIDNCMAIREMNIYDKK